MSTDAIQLDPADDVATALRPLTAGGTITVAHPGGALSLRLAEPIPAFHKIALASRPAGTPIRKYGAVIGELTQAVPAGALVHVHNLQSLKARKEVPS